MKIFRSEFGHDYGTYRFGYCEMAELEQGDDLAAVYAQGFLPYSADPDIQNRFYLARSARVPLQDFSFTSENRRIAKRFDEAFTYEEFPPGDERVHALFLEYFANRHGAHVMSEDRLNGIFSTPLPLHVGGYLAGGVLAAAVLEIRARGMRHFWFSAYDLSYLRQSLGMWLMLDAARRAKTAGDAHYYVGTAYGTKALYKTNLEPLEYWDGTLWQRDVAGLKQLARAESDLSGAARRSDDILVR